VRNGFKDIAHRDLRRCTAIMATGSVEQVQTVLREIVEETFEVDLPPP